jgi:glutamate dehydrogenase (NADP+)
MAQNSARLQWTTEQVDDKLKGIMQGIFASSVTTGAEFSLDVSAQKARSLVQGKQWDTLPSLVVGANINGFKKVADGMRVQGDWW